MPFTNYVPPEKQDLDLPNKLRAEYPGILNWLIEGCLEWQRQGLNPPTEVTDTTAAYRHEQDYVGEWLAECCVLSDNLKIKATNLYQSHCAWCEANKCHQLRQPDLKTKLESFGVSRKRMQSGFFYIGIGLLTEEY
ncbi:MAG: hypothetical protein IH897_13240 [Planctomycetes bacterium]|nr:hypothetical protein [Planctomycetota bacterium]